MTRARNRPNRPSNKAQQPGAATKPAAAKPLATTPAAPAGPPTPVRFLPAVLGVALAVFGLAGGGPDEAGFLWSILGAAAVLIAWNAWMLSRGRALGINVDLRKQHYLQACAQGTVMLWWGFNLPGDLDFVREHLPLVVVQLAFAYGFDLLLSWKRRGAYTLGFGPFPVIFSMNLFLWFKAEWFVLQFAMVAVGFAAKELLRWERDGKKVHIFNPSSFPLAVASLALILTGTTDISHGTLIANSQGIPAHMHLVIFLVALPGQFLFGVASMTASAVVTTYLFGLIYRQVTGTYYFFDVDIPIPVFLGMHLLFTDPSTSPKTELGRIIFGAIYGLSTVALYWIFMVANAPTFYDKLLQVPLMNLSVRAIDRFVRTTWASKLNPERIGRALRPQLRFVAYTAIWVLTFVALQSTRALGDRHPGQWLPYWMNACEAGKPRACAYLAVVEQQLCGESSGWACNEAGILGPQSYPGLEAPMDRDRRLVAFDLGCRLGFKAACHNKVHLENHGTTFEHQPPTLQDYPILLRGSRLGLVTETTPAALYARACREGWPGTCNRAATASP